ncbi:MAG: hypothetical protein AAF203_09140 [Pseudomonadota bacterium]
MFVIRYWILISSLILFFDASAQNTNCVQWQRECLPYDFPNVSPHQATLAGFSIVSGDSGEKIYIGDSKLRPEGYLGSPTYSYQLYQQPHAAPLIFVNAGLGGENSGGAVQFLAEKLHDRGFHVVTLSSTFTAEFANLVARHPFVGQARWDAVDLYKIMTAIKEQLTLNLQIPVTGWGLTGFSWGGLTSAHLLKIDQVEREFSFFKTVLINPPIDLKYATRVVDELYTPTDLPFPLSIRFLDVTGEILPLSLYYASASPETADFMGLINDMGRSDEDLKFFAGQIFHKALRDVMMNSQVVHPLGFFSGTSASWDRQASHYSFEDWVNVFFRAFYEDSLKGRQIWTQHYGTPHFEIEAFSYQNSLLSLGALLKNEESLVILHNEDDYITSEASLKKIKATMGDRLVLFPRGGHVGNLWHPTFLKIYLSQWD